MKSKFAMLCLLVTTFSLLTGCGTINGFGKDVSKTGHEIQKASR